MLEVRPITYKAACAYISEHHRHIGKPQGWLFGAAAFVAHEIVGVVMVGRPARLLQDGTTAQLHRVCSDGTFNAPSFLIARGRRAAAEVGYRRVFSYTQPGESGASMRAAGFRLVRVTRAQDYDRPCRARAKQPLVPKLVWLWTAGETTPPEIEVLPDGTVPPNQEPSNGGAS